MVLGFKAYGSYSRFFFIIGFYPLCAEKASLIIQHFFGSPFGGSSSRIVKVLLGEFDVSRTLKKTEEKCSLTA
ncbi:MAG: hypothetical protein CMM02_13540 [Rhodopirellula sp.]|nr:hypothetical protein [Rhodopirellula sp.]